MDLPLESRMATGCVKVTMAVSTFLLIILAICFRFLYVDIPKIKGIPEIPGGNFLAGHLYQLGNDHATTAEKWASQYGFPVFQARLGRRRAIFVNTFDAAREWMVKNQSATLDRPRFYTFHGVVSATSAATIGTSPWDERTKKQRRVVGSFTTGPSIQKLRQMLDVEVGSMVLGLYNDSKNGTVNIMPHIYQKRLALNAMMMFCYGTRFSSVTDPLLLQILSDASTIASFRSTNSNPQDFIPHLRYQLNERTAAAVEVRQRRDTWLSSMLDNVRNSLPLRNGSKKCVSEMLLTDNQEGLTQLDIKTILSGLMSGGFETIFSTAIITVGFLSTPEGQGIQNKAYSSILDVYNTLEEAIEHCLTEEKCEYVSALVKEALRFYPPLKLLPARQTYKDFTCQGAHIPKGVLVYVNAQAVNRDKLTYGEDADQFRPERWTDKTCNIAPPYHFAYGAGSRMCTAVNFANRVLYSSLLRLIISFKMTESKEFPVNTHYINYKKDPTASNAIPSDFEVRFTPRDESSLKRYFDRSQEQSAAFE
ncbi:cytochrome P450 [Penicillium longicatenatum]|uniref:cytochrome P450 n=1 Tax=Penicillium longicatenatum TaxID=1561947 RepID=UPI0025498B94|nr:cytochrome P450 [Penicillium longicatenatum]KAJ5642861.1 cytochrome P450 [Penicillium longicatenatum]